MKIPNFRYSVQVRGPLQQHLKSAHLPQSEHGGAENGAQGFLPGRRSSRKSSTLAVLLCQGQNFN